MSRHTAGSKPFYKLWWFWLIVALVILTAVGSVAAAFTSDKGNNEDIVAGIDASSELASSSNTGSEYDNLEEDIVSDVEKNDDNKADSKDDTGDSNVADDGVNTFDGDDDANATDVVEDSVDSKKAD